MFRDSLTPDIDTDIAREGFEVVRMHAPNLDIAGLVRKLAIHTTDPGKIRFNKLPNPLNMVLTKRPIDYSTRSDRDILGITTHDPRQQERALAIVTVGAQQFRTRSQYTVAHELGHMLNIKTANEADPSHCDKETCIMYPELLMKPASLQMGTKSLDRWMEHIGLRVAKNTTPEHLASKFCDDCAEQLGRRAFWLGEQLNGGIRFPQEWQ